MHQSIIVVFLLLGSLLSSTQSTPSSEDIEAYAQVDMQLSEPREDSNIEKQVREVTAGLKNALDMMRKSIPKQESSRSAEVRGITVELMEQLIKLAETSDLDSFNKLSEQIGSNLLSIEREGNRKLPQLETYLVSLVASRDSDNNKRESPKKGNWFSDLVAKIFNL